MKSGDVVRLKSGGPDMTVISCSPNKLNIHCIWFSDGKVYDGWYALSTLLIKSEGIYHEIP